MPKLGSKTNPICVNVRSMEDAHAIIDFCEERGWKVVAGIDPSQPENLSDLEKILNEPPPESPQPKIGRNEPCPCGSGKKYKKCCLNNTSSPSG